MNKPIRNAIAQGYPMQWEMDPSSVAGCMRLVAITYTYENGNVRTRTLERTYSPVAACRLSREIAAASGKLEGPSPDDLHARWSESQP